ncbi:MAG: hypothetical protein ACT4QG_16535 [Sporichthyaceae bacterium]
MTYRIMLSVGAAERFHHLPAPARDALVSRAADLIERPWDNVRALLPGDDPAFRGTTFDDGRGMLEFHVDDAGEVIRIFDIVWLG